jgi:hypothetical protein
MTTNTQTTHGGCGGERRWGTGSAGLGSLIRRACASGCGVWRRMEGIFWEGDFTLVGVDS